MRGRPSACVLFEFILLYKKRRPCVVFLKVVFKIDVACIVKNIGKAHDIPIKLRIVENCKLFEAVLLSYG